MTNLRFCTNGINFDYAGTTYELDCRSGCWSLSRRISFANWENLWTGFDDDVIRSEPELRVFLARRDLFSLLLVASL